MPTTKVDWSKWDHLLGVIPDKELAQQLGCTADNVRIRRNKKQISPVIKSSWKADDISLSEKDMRRCVYCESIKNLSFFYTDDTARDGRRRVCIDCSSEQSRNKRRSYKKICIDLLGGKCQHCGFNTYISSLQFHHVADDKEFHISKTIKSIDDIKSELDKCCLLCSNCHDAYHGGDLSLDFIKISLGYSIRSKNGV